MLFYSEDCLHFTDIYSMPFKKKELSSYSHISVTMIFMWGLCRFTDTFSMTLVKSCVMLLTFST